MTQEKEVVAREGNLVLTRRIGEGIIIGPNVKVAVVSIDRGQVRISINAPKLINIKRDEFLVEGEKFYEAPK